MLKTSDFYYDLPKELIAQTPLTDRAASRMLILDKATGGVTHGVFRDIVNFARSGDVFVLNDTRVIPARLVGERDNGGNAELLLLERESANVWRALARPGRRLKVGRGVRFGELLTGKIIGEDGGGVKRVEFFYDGAFEAVLDKLGETPLPPYITEKLADKSRYQTVYAQNDGSAAAPTAGLHFTPEILGAIEDKGAVLAKITLHVGLGTFRPVQAAEIENHEMHEEFYSVSRDSADKINAAKAAGGRVIAVGTTSARTLESAVGDGGAVKAGSGRTSIFIYPPYKFKAADALLTNFHLPESTLIMLVSAFAGRENTLAAYREAVELKYRFFSFGDCCLIC